MGEEILWPPKEESDDPEIENSTLAKQKQLVREPSKLFSHGPKVAEAKDIGGGGGGSGRGSKRIIDEENWGSRFAAKKEGPLEEVSGRSVTDFNMSESKSRLELLGSTNTATAKTTKRKARTFTRASDIQKHEDGVSRRFGAHMQSNPALFFFHFASITPICAHLRTRTNARLPSGWSLPCTSTEGNVREAARLARPERRRRVRS